MSDEEDFVITSRDLVDCGFCFGGQEQWFPVYGYNIRDIVKNGIKASELESTGDALALRAVKLMRERRGF